MSPQCENSPERERKKVGGLESLGGGHIHQQRIFIFLNNLNSPDFEKKTKICQISTLGTPVGSHGIEGFWKNFTIRSALIVNLVSKNCHIGGKKREK